jgi:anion-transporting  ArsA/GET3 family ATPase
MLLDDLLRPRVLILSGKGGVGKSLVGMALAHAATERGKRVLLVEIDAPREAARYLGAPSVGARETEIAPGLHAVNLSPRGAMDEYVRQIVKLPMLTDRILKNPVYDRFFAAAPGLKELMVLGKIMVLEEERTGLRHRPRYDLIIVDAPATGHGLSLLKVPIAAAKAVPVGPVGANARRILTLLRDPAKTALVIVTIPEEMAVVEAAQFHRMATEEVGLTARAVVLNAAHERRFSEAEEAQIQRLARDEADGPLVPGLRLARALLSARRHVRRRKLTRFYETRLRRALPLPLVSLPFLFREEIGPAEIRFLAERLAAAE